MMTMHDHFPYDCKKCTKAILYKSHLTQKTGYPHWAIRGVNTWKFVQSIPQLHKENVHWTMVFNVTNNTKKYDYNEVVGTVAWWMESMTVWWHLHKLRRC